jgi:hypothetical protein
MQIHLPDALGLIGVSIVLWYCGLLQSGKCRSDDLSFSIANFIGSGLMLISLVFSWNLSSFVIELA